MMAEKKSKHRSLNNLTIHSSWLAFEEGVVIKMAQTILNEGRFEELPYLADALEEAGCTDKNILDHLRQPHITHNENCIVLNTILGREVPYDLTILDNNVAEEVYEGLGLLKEYQSFVQTKHRGIIPQKDSYWTIPRVEGTTCNGLIAYLRSLGVKVTTYAQNDDLDSEVTNQPRPNTQGSYFFRVKANREADKENAKKSANILGKKHTGIRLEERLLLGAFYFVATGEHLDQDNITLCTGSRHRLGRVPFVYWDAGSGGLLVDLYDADGSSGDLRSRSVVSSTL